MVRLFTFLVRACVGILKIHILEDYNQYVEVSNARKGQRKLQENILKDQNLCEKNPAYLCTSCDLQKV